MNINTKMTFDFSEADAHKLVQEAVFNLLRDKYNIDVSLSDIDIKFNATMRSYDMYDRGPGDPTFSGITATIKQASPVDRSR